MKRTFALLTAVSAAAGAIAVAGCEHERDDHAGTTRIYRMESDQAPSKARVYETRDGTVIATDGENVTAVQTPAPRGDRAAERMGMSAEDMPPVDRSGGDATVRTRSEGGTVVDEPGRGREGSSVTGGTGIGGGSVDPLVQQRGDTIAEPTDRDDEAIRARGEIRVDDESTGNRTTGGVVVPDRDEDTVIIPGDVTPDRIDRDAPAVRGDTRQTDPTTPQRRQTPDPGAAGNPPTDNNTQRSP